MPKLGDPIPLVQPLDAFSRIILEKMREFRKNRHLTDVMFRVGENEKIVMARRLVLCATSPYFREIFASKSYQSKSIVNVKEIEPDVFELLIESCYTGVIVPEKNNVRQLLVAAMKLRLDDVIKVCTGYMVGKLNENNLKKTDKFATEVKCQYLSDAIIEYASRNFISLSRSVDFLHFSVDTVEHIIENAELNINSEEDVFHAIVRWFHYNEDSRAPCVARLLGSIHMTELAPAFILKHVQPLPGCEQLALEALEWFHIPESRCTSTLRYTAPRSTNTSLVAIQITGQNNSIMRFDPKGNSWTLCTELKMRRWFFKVLFLQMNLIFVGGVTGTQWHLNNCVITYNLVTHKWDSFLPMRNNRRGFCVVLLRGDIYAIGGYDQSTKSPFSLVEKFDMKLQRWCPVAKLLVPRCFANAVVYADQIYVAGGLTTGDVCINAVECYDPDRNIWDCRADMLNSRSLHGMTQLKGLIYAIGGANDAGYIAAVERFDPQQNTWKAMEPLSAPRQQLCTITYMGNIYAVGGWRDQALNTVELYDAEKNKWETRCELPEPAQYNCVVVPTYLIEKLETSWKCSKRCSSHFQEHEA